MNYLNISPVFLLPCRPGGTVLLLRESQYFSRSFFFSCANLCSLV